MPSQSEKQRKFFGAELGRKRAGEATDTGMDEKTMEEFAKKPVEHKKDEKRGMHSDAHSGHGRHKKGRGMGG